MNGSHGGVSATCVRDAGRASSPPLFRAKAPCLRRGFTLVELLVVVAIIAILAGLVLGIAGYASQKADRGRAISELERIKNALEEYRIAYGTFPQNTASADSRNLASALWYKPQQEGRKPFLTWKGWNNPNASTNRIYDPWGNEYRYYYDADGNPNYSPNNNSKLTYDLWSVGPSAAPNQTDDDITNWKGDF